MNKKTNGYPREDSHLIKSQKVPIEYINPPDPFQDLLSDFEKLRAIKDPVREEFELVQLKRTHQIDLGSLRRMYALWKEQERNHVPS